MLIRFSAINGLVVHVTICGKIRTVSVFLLRAVLKLLCPASTGLMFGALLTRRCIMAFEHFACFAIAVLTVCAVFAIAQTGFLAFRLNRFDVLLRSEVTIISLYSFILCWLNLIERMIFCG